MAVYRLELGDGQVSLTVNVDVNDVVQSITLVNSGNKARISGVVQVRGDVNKTFSGSRNVGAGTVTVQIPVQFAGIKGVDLAFGLWYG